MGALARGLVHKSACLTSATWRHDQSGARTEDADRAGRGDEYGVISFRKMRQRCGPSYCGSFLLSFLVNNNHQWTPFPTHTSSTTPRGLVERGDSLLFPAGWGDGGELWGRCRAGTVHGAETHQDDSWGEVLRRYNSTLCENYHPFLSYIIAPFHTSIIIVIVMIVVVI